MVDEISFIHAADLHLDSPFKGLSNVPDKIFNDIRNSTFKALNHLVEAAIKNKVDFVLLAGDSFDNEVQSLKAQVRLRDAFETLNQHNIYVYMSCGNHDYQKGNIHSVTYPDNVYIFPDETVKQFIHYNNNEKVASIYGFSYESRSVTENKTKEYIIEDEDIPFHIAMLHGSLQSNTTHDTYAPFQLSELNNHRFDYWALGHIHQKEILQMNPPVIYSGNTQGRHRKEHGEKGCYHIVLTKAEPTISFIPLQFIQFENISLDAEVITDIYDLEQQLQTIIHKFDQTSPLLIHLTFKGDQGQLAEWEKENYLSESIELVNEWGLEQASWRYIYKNVIERERRNEQSGLKIDHFMKQLVHQLEYEVVADDIHPLYNHRKGRKFLERPSESEIEAIKKAAHQLLITELRGKEGENH